MKEVHFNRLAKTAILLYFLAEEKEPINMAHYRQCDGTPACAFGWATLMFPKIKWAGGCIPLFNGQHGIMAVAEFYGLTISTAQHIFGMSYGKDPKVPADRIIKLLGASSAE